MKSPWTRLAQQGDGTYAVEDFERAAYKLMTDQVLYGHERGSRHLYHLVEAHLGEFTAVFEPFGVRLQRNPHHRYIIAQPLHGDGQKLRLDETLLLLVLRHRYDNAMREGQVEEHGDVAVELPELQEAYQALVQRPMPETTALRQLAQVLKRWSLVQVDEEEADAHQPFRIIIRPAICEVLGEQWLQRLRQHQADDGSDADETESA